MRQAFLCIFFLVLVCSHSLAAPKIQVSIDFEGNKKVSASSLKKVAINELADFRKKGLRPADADDAAFQMEQAYQKKGYPFVIVKYRLQKEKKKARLLFLVEEGQRVSIDTLEISGNSVFNDQTIRRVIGVTKKGFFGKKNFFVEDRLNSGISSLYDFYLYRGYMDVKISRPQLAFSSDKKKVQITVEIDEGSRFFIRGVEFEGEIPVSLIKKLGEMGRKLGGTPFQQRIPLFLKGQIQQLLGNSGYPEARVATVLKKIGVRGEVALRVSIHSGPLVKLRNVRIQGNEKTRAGLIFDRMMLKKGDLYTLDKKKSSFRNLFRTGFFKKVSMEIEEENGERDLVVHVTEALTKEFFFEGGWGSYERLRGKAGIKDKNIFGTGKIASLEAGLSTRSLFTTVSIADLWLFNTRMTGDLPVFYQERQEPSFTKIDSGFSVHISLPYTEFVNYSAEYGFQRTRLQNVSAQALQENQLIAYQQGIFKLQTTFDTRDDIFTPTSGTRMTFLVETAHPYLGSNLSLYRMSWDSRFYKSLWKKSTVLAVRYTTGLVIPGGRDDNVPLGERFFIGGENTVRSFRESTLGPRDTRNDPIGGVGFNIVNIELRQRFFRAFAGTLFFDAGNVTPNISRSVRGEKAYDSRKELLNDTIGDFLSSFKTGVGVGLQYLLPIGPLRLDVAYNPSVQQEDSRYLVHFSVGTAF